MRANRLLGAGLVEANLVKIEDLEKANERLLELLAGDAERQATVLGVLAYEKKVMSEDDFLHHLAETEGLGLIDLRGYDPPEEFRKEVDLGSCWATWTVPFDQEENFTAWRPPITSARPCAPIGRSSSAPASSGTPPRSKSSRIISKRWSRRKNPSRCPGRCGCPVVAAAAGPGPAAPVAPAPTAVAKSA